MFIIKFDDEKAVVSDNDTYAQAAKASGAKVLDCHDCKSFDDAQAAADLANSANDGKYVATVRTKFNSPRYDVVGVPKVGDFVSRGFNGDYYPIGKVVSVGTGVRMTITTDDGSKFNRVRKTGSWKEIGGEGRRLWL